MPAGLAHTAEKDKQLSCDVLSRGGAELMGALLASVLSLHGEMVLDCLLRKSKLMRGVVTEELGLEGRQFANYESNAAHRFRWTPARRQHPDVSLLFYPTPLLRRPCFY